MADTARRAPRRSVADPLVLGLLPRAGRGGRELAVRLDLLRSLGIRHAWARRRDAARVDAIPTDGSRAGYEEIWRDAAGELGAEVVKLPHGFLEIRRGEARTRVWNHMVPLDDGVTLKLSLEKALVHELLAGAGVPVPQHVELDARRPEPAQALLAQHADAWVVKPVAGYGGSGATTGVRTARQLRRAIVRAGRIDRRLLIERQARGDVHRLLLLDGELLDVVRRRSPSVTGDGRSTIGALIAQENRRRIEQARGARPGLLHADLDCLFTLEAAGLSLDSVPSAGARVAVKTSVSQGSAQDSEGVLRDGGVSPELVAEARAAVDAIGLRLAAVEVVTPDVSRSLREAGGVVIEVNGPPGLHYHYDVREPQHAVRVAVPILRKLLGAA